MNVFENIQICFVSWFGLGLLMVFNGHFSRVVFALALFCPVLLNTFVNGILFGLFFVMLSRVLKQIQVFFCFIVFAVLLIQFVCFWASKANPPSVSRLLAWL